MRELQQSENVVHNQSRLHGPLHPLSLCVRSPLPSISYFPLNMNSFVVFNRLHHFSRLKVAQGDLSVNPLVLSLIHHPDLLFHFLSISLSLLWVERWIACQWWCITLSGDHNMKVSYSTNTIRIVKWRQVKTKQEVANSRKQHAKVNRAQWKIKIFLIALSEHVKFWWNLPASQEMNLA